MIAHYHSLSKHKRSQSATAKKLVIFIGYFQLFLILNFATAKR